MRKYIITIIASVLLTGMALYAQEPQSNDRTVVADTVLYRPADAVDTNLEGKSIFSILGKENSGITLTQDPSIAAAMSAHIQSNKSKNIAGYRVRIFFDNKQNSRGASEDAVARFRALHPGTAAYRSFTSPFFKVTVGDFRTRSEAARFLTIVKSEFPSAFIVKENINYPAADRQHAFITDTVKVVRPAEQTVSAN